MDTIKNEMTRQTVGAFCMAVDHIATIKGVDPADISMAGALAAFELAARRMGPVAAIEYMRGVADILEKQLLDGVETVANG